ncbi:MAG TPA: sulfatase [Planctomycetes bacterium]|nr:sulfatase [Planctomycetota bacterium]
MRRPNIIFILSDDHAAHAISAYGGGLNHTPHIDRLATTGVRCTSTFCTNSICAPSRAAILTGTWNHVNGVRTLHDRFDGTQDTVAKRLQAAGYQTALFGKWHLGQGGSSDPTGFDRWCVLPGQGAYWNPAFHTPEGKIQVQGYVSDIITDQSLAWLEGRDQQRPFMLMLHHKAPHREWEYHPRHAHLYPEGTIPEPPEATFYDDHSGHATAAKMAKMRLEDMQEKDLGAPIPTGLSPRDEHRWRYQRYLARYLRTVQSVDDSVGRVLDWLEAKSLREDTIVIYTSDQGFFLGEHGWFDKRFMYEESLRMPFLASWPGRLPQGVVNDDILLNTDIAPTFLEWAGIERPAAWQGRSFVSCLEGRTPRDWRDAFYYRYWMHKDGAHHVWAHYGLRTRHHKLIHYYADPLDTDPAGCLADQSPEPPEWELFDLRKDPFELTSVHDDPDYAAIRDELTVRLHREQAAVGDRPYDPAEAARGRLERAEREARLYAGAIPAWRVLGPFPGQAGKLKLTTTTPIESDLIAGRGVALPDGIRDLQATAGTQAFVDLDKVLGRREYAICYAVHAWHEPAPRRVELAIGSDDAVEAWLDGTSILRVDGERGYTVGENRVRLDLAAGPHRLVLKIINYREGWGFGAMLDVLPG